MGCHFVPVAMMITSLILSLLVSYVSSKGCNLPPSAWCSSPETAELCQVKDVCKEYLYPAAKAPKVNIDLYHESLCPYCINFIIGQATKAYHAVGSIMNLELFPFGNAEIKTNANGTTTFTCQHGPLECEGNLMETCALNILPKSKSFLYISCVSRQIKAKNTPYLSYLICGRRLQIDVDKLFECSNSEKGLELEKAVAKKTNSLKPRKTYVPWIVVNGVHTKELQSQATTDLVDLVCRTYKGSDKPKSCKSS